MKRKLLIILIIMLGIHSHCYTQNHNFSAAVGIGSTNHFVDFVSDIALTILPFGTTYENRNTRGEYRAGYSYQLLRRLHLGASASYTNIQTDAYVSGAKDGHIDRNYYTIALESRYNYFNTDWLQLYGLLGLGVTRYNYTYTPVDGRYSDAGFNHFFNFHVTPVGVSVGRRIGGFAELGFGYRGIFSLGAFFKL